MGRTEFLTPTIRSEPWVGKRKPTKRAKWRSFYECMQECAQNLVDTADIVRDGDVTQLRITTGAYSALFRLRTSSRKSQEKGS